MTKKNYLILAAAAAAVAAMLWWWMMPPRTEAPTTPGTPASGMPQSPPGSEEAAINQELDAAVVGDLDAEFEGIDSDLNRL